MSTPRRTYPFVRPPELDGGGSPRRPVIVVGAGPVGLTMAIDLIERGIPAIVIDDDNTVSVGSRAICYAKRTLEIWDRLACGEVMLNKGVTWNVGKVYLGDDPDPIYTFNMLDEEGYKYPGFINLQQYYNEEFLIDRLSELGGEIRWLSKVVGVKPHGGHVAISVETSAGTYELTCDYLIAADGSKSPIRRMMGLDFEGKVFEDHFLIADIKMKQPFPSERRFWFDPVFNKGQSALLHKQPDDVWRLDLQLGWDIDREAEMKPERVAQRVRAALPGVEFEFEWISIYTFQCRRLDKFRHGRVIFVGDSAHLVSPFGARGANSGVQDADNLGWKLQLVLAGKAPDHLLDSYDAERLYAAKENLLNSTRSTDFITPKSRISRAFRDAVLQLAGSQPFARPMVNSGRLSVPAILRESPLNTPDTDAFAGKMAPGAPAADGRVHVEGRDEWLLTYLARSNGGRERCGTGFTALYFAGSVADDRAAEAAMAALRRDAIPVSFYVVGQPATPLGCPALEDVAGHLTRRYDARPGTVYLLRPDHHVAGRWRRVDAAKVRAARDHATGHTALTVLKEHVA